MKKEKTIKRAVVLGASSGIGAFIAKKLLADGWQVGLAARREAPLKALSDEFPGQAEIEIIDITKEDAPQALERLIEKLGGMDLYFHSSGIGQQNQELDSSVNIKICNTNVLGFVRMVDAAFNYFVKTGRKGHIAAISSVAGTGGIGVSPSYSATKAFDINYLEALDQLARLRKLDIRITDIRPGFISTPLLKQGRRYPMLMDIEYAGNILYRKLKRGRSAFYVDWRYSVLCFIWRILPRWIWVRLSVKNQKAE